MWLRMFGGGKRGDGWLGKISLEAETWEYYEGAET